MQLAPSPAGDAPPILTFDQVLPHLEDVNTEDLDVESLSRTVILGGGENDSLMATLSMHEYPPLLYLDVWLYNRFQEPITISPSMFALVDGTKTQFRQLEAHEAARMYASQVKGIPSFESVYEPKEQYRVDTYSYGNYSTSTIREQQTIGESSAKLGYAIGSMIRQKQNEQLRNAAAVIYAEGLVPNTEIEPDAALRFGVFWLNEPVKTYPLELRIMDDVRRIHFERPRN